MIALQVQIIFIACLVAIACVLPGVFLVLRGVALMSDAISHAILLGIIVMFLLVHQLDSPLLLIGASLAGLFIVVCTELIIHTNYLKKDAAIGLVFPLFFSVGVILISQYARNVHLDTDMVLLGELAFIPFNRLVFYGIDCGPNALWIMGFIVLLNCLFITLFYKELKLVIFDSTLAHVLGFSPLFLYYGLMAITSITAVGAFDAVGSIVVVALMITPAAIAYLLTDCLKYMLILSMIIGIISAIMGYGLAYWLDVSIAGSIATMTGIIFIFSLFCAPQRGIFAQLFFKRKRNVQMAQDILCAYLLELLKKNVSKQHYEITMIAHALGWNTFFVSRVLKDAIKSGIVQCYHNHIMLTDLGLSRGDSR